MSSKDRSSLFDGKIVSKPDEKVGRILLDWLNRGGPVPPSDAKVHDLATIAPAGEGRRLTAHLLGQPRSNPQIQPPSVARPPAEKVELVRLVSSPAKSPREDPRARTQSQRPPLFDREGNLIPDGDAAARSAASA